MQAGALATASSRATLRLDIEKPADVNRGEREHLPPCPPDKAETYGYDARAVADNCSIVRPCEQSCPLCEPEKPNSNK
jgi:hypothetical protein